MAWDISNVNMAYAEVKGYAEQVLVCFERFVAEIDDAVTADDVEQLAEDVQALVDDLYEAADGLAATARAFVDDLEECVDDKDDDEE